jgi:hypothetical protein
MAGPEDVVDSQRNDSWDQTVLEAFAVNLKSLVDSHLGHTDVRESDGDVLLGNRGHATAQLQDKVNQLFLEGHQQHNSIVNRLAQDSATVSGRVASNAVTLDGMIYGGLMTRPDEIAEAAIGKNVSDSTADVARDAIRAAVAQTQQTSAPAQGTTGVAQGALQTQEPILLASELAGMVEVNKALGVQLAKLAEAINVLIIRETEAG